MKSKCKEEFTQGKQGKYPGSGEKSFAKITSFTPGKPFDACRQCPITRTPPKLRSTSTNSALDKYINASEDSIKCC